MRRLNSRQAVTRRDRINRRVARLKYKYEEENYKPVPQPKTSFPLPVEVVFAGTNPLPANIIKL